MNLRKGLLYAGILALCLSALSGSALAQSQANTGQIVGSVADPNGAVVPGARITLTSLDTGAVRELVTNEAGQYRAVLLPAGRYKVAASASGFAPATVAEVVVNVGAAVDVNFSLKIGAVAETIEVSAPLVEVTRSESGAIVNSQLITNLPINGRRFHDFATLTPSALVEGSRQQISILGQRGINTSINIDGADYNEPFFGGIRGGERSMMAFTVPQESIAEFQVVTASYAAEFGRSTGGIVTAITKSGTNDLHGSAFYLLRQKELGVKDGLNRQSLENRHQFGGAVGGPIVRDRIFLFGALEKQYSRYPRQVFFPALHSAATPKTANNGEAYDYYMKLEEPFTQTNDPLALNTRFDYQFKGGHRFFARYNHSRNDELNAVTTGTAINPLISRSVSNNGTEIDRTHTVNAQMVSLLNPRLANEFRFAYSREARPRLNNGGTSPELATTIGTVGTVQYLPTTMTDYRLQFADNLSWQRGTHSLKIGFEFNHTNAFQTFGFGQFGMFNVSGSNVDQALSLLSHPAGATTNRFDSTSVTYQRQIGNLLTGLGGNEPSLYFQDSWRVKSGFTLNYGIRWEAQSLTDPVLTNTDYLNRLLASNFPLGKVDPRYAPSMKKEVMPRAGFAWDPRHNGKTVIRGNFGLFYARTPLLIGASPYNNFRNPPGDLRVSLPFNVPAGNPNNTIYRQFKLVGIDLNSYTLDKLPILTIDQVMSIPAALGTASSYNPFQGTAPMGWGIDYKNPRSLQWGFGVEHEIARGISLFGNYTCANTIHLERNREYNVPAPMIRPTDKSQRPFFGLVSNTLQRPNTFFGSVQVRESSARSLYRAAVFGAKVSRKRYQLNAYYTLGWNYSDDDNERSSGGSDIENAFNLKNEYYYSNLDARHILGATALIHLPLGIELSNLWRMRSAYPFTPAAGSDANEDRNSGANNDRAYLATGVPYKRNSFRNTAAYNSDLRVLKGFPLRRERAKIQLSAEMFNIFNFDNITIGSSNQIYGLGIDPATGTAIPPGLTAAGAPVRAGAAFRRLKLADGSIDPNNTVGVPFQFQLGLRFIF